MRYDRLPPPLEWWRYAPDGTTLVRTDDPDFVLARIERIERPGRRPVFDVEIPGCGTVRARTWKDAREKALAHWRCLIPRRRRQTPAIAFENAPLRFGSGGAPRGWSRW